MNDMPDKPTLPAAGFFLYCGEVNSPRWLALRNATHGAWGFPKGHSREGESLLQAAHRELEEETGIEAVKVIEGFQCEIEYEVVSPRRGTYLKRVVYYLAFTPSQETAISSEHDEYRWVSSKEMLELIAFDNLREAFNAALSFLGESKQP